MSTRFSCSFVRLNVVGMATFYRCKCSPELLWHIELLFISKPYCIYKHSIWNRIANRFFVCSFWTLPYTNMSTERHNIGYMSYNSMYTHNSINPISMAILAHQTKRPQCFCYLSEGTINRYISFQVQYSTRYITWIHWRCYAIEREKIPFNFMRLMGGIWTE